MSQYKTDHRWSPGASWAELPESAPAMYSARWIDHNNTADILPDRQGFAYNDESEKKRLIAVLKKNAPHHHVGNAPHDATHKLLDDGEAVIYIRRAGGYIYADAWLKGEV